VISLSEVPEGKLREKANYWFSIFVEWEKSKLSKSRYCQLNNPTFPDLNQALGLKQVQKFTFVKSFRTSVHPNADPLGDNCSISAYYLTFRTKNLIL